jgi:hypothetical protein
MFFEVADFVPLPSLSRHRNVPPASLGVHKRSNAVLNRSKAFLSALTKRNARGTVFARTGTDLKFFILTEELKLGTFWRTFWPL